MNKFSFVADKDTQLLKVYEEQMYQLRHKTFKEKLKWDVSSFENKEIDIYDSQEDTKYIITSNRQGKLLGSMRLIPTIKPNMLKDIFYHLLPEDTIPEHQNIWEISRFTVATEYNSSKNNQSFNEESIMLIKSMCDFAKEKDIQSYVAVTTAPMERLTKQLKMSYKKLGVTKKIGEVNTIVLQVFMNEQSFEAINNAYLKIII